MGWVLGAPCVCPVSCGRAGQGPSHLPSPCSSSLSPITDSLGEGVTTSITRSSSSPEVAKTPSSPQEGLWDPGIPPQGHTRSSCWRLLPQRAPNSRTGPESQHQDSPARGHHPAPPSTPRLALAQERNDHPPLHQSSQLPPAGTGDGERHRTAPGWRCRGHPAPRRGFLPAVTGRTRAQMWFPAPAGPSCGAAAPGVPPASPREPRCAALPARHPSPAPSQHVAAGRSRHTAASAKSGGSCPRPGTRRVFTPSPALG